MLHFIYKLNLFGDKDSRSKIRNMHRRSGGLGGPPPDGFEGGHGGMGGFGGRRR